MIRRPPRSTLFPTRRSSDLIALRLSGAGARTAPASVPPPSAGPNSESRSEEHTSELQSLTNLVCRLLLEKKKNKKARDCMKWNIWKQNGTHTVDHTRAR